ncbi:zf-HC2 domain-containing protein [uncultured Clostridium sp.]|uniref:zf-HC2 domain-containing protein n=1 Tax=uncultured Clostridium sp. TaxID=59620 RepID=UPI002637FDEF|nr:zf-HC2 domain-containing protein [uncultured Clostridium sp.]
MEMENCNVIKDLISLYIDDLLSDDSKSMVDKHISECDECKKYLDNMSEDIKCDISLNESDLAQVKLVEKIKRANSKKLIFITVIGGIFASVFTSDEWIFRGVLIMPLLGAGIYLKYRSLFIAPCIVSILKTIIDFCDWYGGILNNNYDISYTEYIGAIFYSFSLSIVFAFFTGIGVIIGVLIKKIFIDE